ncbi:MAG: carbon storage regulator [Gammaproteobacteria bacterium]|nr:carbon storage regulator [Gammaproteobacteria bacterium]
MLILSRSPGETIVIGENIRVTVLGVHRGVVRFGIDAPREIPVDRLEIHERKVAERANGHPALDRSLEA